MKDKIIYWSPRVLSIILLIFLALMSLDVISSESSLGEIIVGLLIHNIPVIILTIILIISWKYEIVGGIAFILCGLLYVGVLIYSKVAWYLVLSWGIEISGLAFAIGILFLINWYKKKK